MHCSGTLFKARAVSVELVSSQFVTMVLRNDWKLCFYLFIYFICIFYFIFFFTNLWELFSHWTPTSNRKEMFLERLPGFGVRLFLLLFYVCEWAQVRLHSPQPLDVTLNRSSLCTLKKITAIQKQIDIANWDMLPLPSGKPRWLMLIWMSWPEITLYNITNTFIQAGLSVIFQSEVIWVILRPRTP